MIKKVANTHKSLLLILATVFLGVISARIEALHFLAFVALLPLPFLLKDKATKDAVKLMALCALLLWVGTSYWLVPANISFAGSNTIIVILVFLLFCLWQSLPYIALAFFYSRFNWQHSALGPVLAAACLTAAWTFIPSPLPWLPINSLYVYPKFVALLDLSGISILLFASIFYCFAIEYISRKQAAYKKIHIASMVLIPLLMLSYGQYRQIQLDTNKAKSSADQWLDIGYIQPNLKFDDPFDYTYLLTEQLILEKRPDLIVWPEISSPYSIDNSSRNKSDTFKLVEKYQQDLVVVSGYIFTGNYIGDRQTYYNQAQLIKNQEIQGRYSKEILVPFFEYMPKMLSFLRPLMPKVLIYEAGKDQTILEYTEKIKLAMAICYEVIFPNYVRKQIAEGGNILINPSSDAAFGGGVGGYYHLVTAYFRAIENRVPWVRSTNTGISVIVDADGKMLTEKSQVDKVAVDSAKVFIPQKASVYSRIGNWFAIFAFLFVTGYQGLVFIKQNNTREEKNV